MKSIIKTAGIVLAASVIGFTSCTKKENINDLKSSDDQAKDNYYRDAAGSASATISGVINDYTNYDNKSFSVEKTFNYSEDNAGEINNKSTETRYFLKDGSYDYVEKQYSITMFETSGEDYDDFNNGSYIRVSFSIYTGTLPTYMVKAGYSTGIAQDISASYRVVYNPEETIDVISVGHGFGTTMMDDIKVEKVTISELTTDESGSISFKFKASDSIDEDKPQISGEVSTSILVNEIKPENDYNYSYE